MEVLKNHISFILKSTEFLVVLHKDAGNGWTGNTDRKNGFRFL